MNQIQGWLNAVVAGLRACGLVGWLGLALLALAVWAQAVWLPQRRAETAQWASDARGLRHALQDELTPAAGRGATAQAEVAAFGHPGEAWQALWQALPGASSRVALPAAVLQAARQQGLQVSAVQYQGDAQPWATQGDQTLWRQRMTMPVQGSAAALHAWVAALLREPALSMETLTMQRDAATADTVTAQVGLSLWWKQPAAAASTQAGGQP